MRPGHPWSRPIICPSYLAPALRTPMSCGLRERRDNSGLDLVHRGAPVVLVVLEVIRVFLRGILGILVGWIAFRAPTYLPRTLKKLYNRPWKPLGPAPSLGVVSMRRRGPKMSRCRRATPYLCECVCSLVQDHCVDWTAVPVWPWP